MASAVAEIKLLKGQSATVILGVDGGAQVTAAALAASLTAMFSVRILKIPQTRNVALTIMQLVITACGSVLAVAGTNFSACQGLLAVVALVISLTHSRGSSD